MPPAKALVLFDIDGTLLRGAGPHHREALSAAIKKVTGLETTTHGIALAGMLDRDILTELLRREGMSDRAIRQAMPDLIERAQRFYVRRAPDLRRKVCPGVRGLLYTLLRRGIPVGLVTGNLTRIGWKKMDRAGLRDYFRFGAFAEQARDRAGLVGMAIRHARRKNWIDADSPIALLGDHMNDVKAAQAHGVRAIAVSTGLSSPEELAQSSPDLLIPDARGLSIDDLLGVTGL